MPLRNARELFVSHITDHCWLAVRVLLLHFLDCRSKYLVVQVCPPLQSQASSLLAMHITFLSCVQPKHLEGLVCMRRFHVDYTAERGPPTSGDF